MARGADDALLDVELNPALVEWWASSVLDTMLQEGGGEEAEEAGAAASSSAAAAAVAVAAAAAAPLTMPFPADVTLARHVVARWRAFVAARKACPLLDLLQRFPDVFKKEVLERLDPTDRTMVAQVGRPWLAAVLASGLPRLPNGVRVRLRLREFCTSVERLAWAKANGCPWGLSDRSWWTNPCALAAGGGHLETLQWARQHDCPWDAETCRWAAQGGHLEVLRWAREHDCLWDKWTCTYAAQGGHLETLQWARQHGCPWSASTCALAAAGGHLATLQWARANGCTWVKRDCEVYAWNHPDTLAWVQQQQH